MNHTLLKSLSSSQNTWQARKQNSRERNTETSPSISLKRVEKDEKEEEGLQTQLYDFFSMETSRHQNSLGALPLLLHCDCIKSLLHGMTCRGYWTALLVIVSHWVRGSGSCALYWSFVLTELKPNYITLLLTGREVNRRTLQTSKCSECSKMYPDHQIWRVQPQRLSLVSNWVQSGHFNSPSFWWRVCLCWIFKLIMHSKHCL